MSAAKIDPSSRITQLDGKGAPEEQITEEYVKDPPKLSRLLTRMLAVLTPLSRAWSPRRIDFEDVVSTGTSGSPQSLSFSHKFGGRVRWWLVDQYSTGTISLPLVLKDNTKTTADILYLNVYYPMTFTLRVEESG